MPPHADPVSPSDASPSTPSDGPTVVHGTCYALFAYDVGFAINLDETERLLGEAEPRRRKLGRTRRVPASFDFQPPPVFVVREASAIELGNFTTLPRAEAVVFDFGAISVGFEAPLSGELSSLAALGHELYDNETLLAHSRGVVERILDVIRPAVTRPTISGLVEDYVIYHLPTVCRTRPPAEFVKEGRLTLAQMLRGDLDPLADQEIDDALASRITYGPNDMTIVDWNAAVVLEPQIDEVRAVLEYANVELLELRFLDDQLDSDLDQAYERMSRASWTPGFLRLRAAEERHVTRLQMDAAMMFEGVNNALKLVGDQYLARLYRLTAARLHLPTWNASVLRKLSVLETIHQRMVDRGGAQRLEVLEWIIVILIALEVVLPLIPGSPY